SREPSSPRPSISISPVRRLCWRYRYFFSGTCVSVSQSRNSSKGSIHSSPLSTIASIDLSRVTTVHVQQPKRLLPHEGVVSSITKGHSPEFADRYIAARSRLLAPHGDGTCNRYVHTSSVIQSWIGVYT